MAAPWMPKVGVASAIASKELGYVFNNSDLPLVQLLVANLGQLQMSTLWSIV